MDRLGSWNDLYDAKILKLLNKGPLRDIDPNNLSNDYIVDVVIAHYFPETCDTKFDFSYRAPKLKIRNHSQYDTELVAELESKVKAMRRIQGMDDLVLSYSSDESGMTDHGI